MRMYCPRKKKLMKPKALIISSVHRWDDTRIFHRQATSLAKKYDVELHAPADFCSRQLNGLSVIGLPKWKKESDRIRLWWILLKRVFKSDANIVHFHDPELIPLGFIIKLFSKKKVIYDVHEHIIADIGSKNWIPNYMKSLVTKALILLENIAVPKFDAVIYTTPSVGERYLRRSKKAVSIENYSKLDTFDEIQLRKRVSSHKTVIYLGRVLKLKGVHQVIRAFKNVIASLPDARFVIVGDIVPKDFELELRTLTKDLKLEKQIEFAGFIPHLETVEYLTNADCGVVTFLPAKCNTACLPNKLFEYMAAGIPVVASNFPLYREVVEGSKCGLLVNPDNTDMIAEAIVRILGNPEVASQMGLRGREAFKRKYNWEKEEEKLLELYGELLT